MRTRFFRVSYFSEEGKNSFKVLASISESTSNHILRWFREIDHYPRFDSDDIKILADITGDSGDVIINALAAIELIMQEIIDHNESPDDFLLDIKESGIFDSDHDYSSLENLFAELPASIEKHIFHRKASLAEMNGAPVLVDSTMTVAVKPVFRQDFRYNIDLLSDYTPTLIGYTSIALIELQRSDDSGNYSFQINRDNLDRLVTDLLALQAQMSSLKLPIGPNSDYEDNNDNEKVDDAEQQ